MVGSLVDYSATWRVESSVAVSVARTAASKERKLVGLMVELLVEQKVVDLAEKKAVALVGGWVEKWAVE